MSGGSFNYLSSRDLVEEAWGRAIARMRDKLHELGHHDAALRTGEALAALQRADAIRQELEGVWRQTEWHVSCDSSADDVDDQVNLWRTSKPFDPARIDLARRIYELEQEALALRTMLEGGAS